MNRVKNVNKTNQFKTKWEVERESQLHLGREKDNPVSSREGKGKCGYFRGEKREIQLHQGRENKNSVTSRERKGNSSSIRGEKREIQLHPGRKKGNPVTSEEIKDGPGQRTRRERCPIEQRGEFSSVRGGQGTLRGDRAWGEGG